MPFKSKTDHPLNWGDKELAFLISTGMNVTNLYRAMGYKGSVVSPAFKVRVEKLAAEEGK